jgi:hypothetical protein
VIGSPADLMGAFYDLHRQVLRRRERTEEEFRALLGKVGLKLQRIIPTPSPMKMVEASLPSASNQMNDWDLTALNAYLSAPVN